jgi:glycosyltransferase involved in cell wall biosynthesis
VRRAWFGWAACPQYNGSMRIVFVGPFALQPKRTMAVRALPLARALAARGHQVLMVLPPWDSPQDAGREWEEGGVRVCNLPLPMHVPVWEQLVLTARAVRTALRYQPDVIHCFKPKAYAGLTAWAVWQLKRLGWVKVRVVVDSDDWEGGGGWNELEPYPRWQKRFFAWQERWGLTHHDALTVASRALETLAWSLGVPPRKVHYLPNGGLPQESAPPEDEVALLRQRYALADPLVVLLYTRFFEYGLERAANVMQGVLEREPETRWLIVGRGLFGEEERFLEIARTLGIAERVVYAGWVQPERLPAHFALAQAAIYPFDDTLVNRAKCAVKLIDLLAAGVPVVADRVGQNAEYIEHGISGLLVAPGDNAAFVAAVVRLLRDRGLAESLGAAAKGRIRTEFSWGKLASQVERVYGASSAPRGDN